ncbi:hypothetical protein [Streptomyces sp. NPDC046685]|uniref:hypothetical protein n=1 Tax=Streptomyces sp. NPDC046685 TaxID=3157202 RepID=UPI00340820D9
MDSPDADELFDIFNSELRKSDGLTTDKLRKRPELMKLLVDDGTPEEAKAEIEAVVLSRGDGFKARALRNILVITNGRDGIEPRSGPEERRRWATGEGEYAELRDRCFIPKSVGSHVLYEKAEFKEVALLIIERAAQRARSLAKKSAFQEAAQQQLAAAGHSVAYQPTDAVTLDEDDQDATAARDESDDQPPPPAEPENTGSISAAEVGNLEPTVSQRPIPVVRVLREIRDALGSRRTVPPTLREHKVMAAFIGSWCTLLALVLILWATDSLPSWLQDRSKPDKAVSASAPSGVKVTSAPQIDNTRGWGPERKTFTMQHPAAYPVFNSITDNPTHGDERNFVQCKDADEGNERYADELVAKDKHTYDCYALVVNDIAPNLDSIASPNVGGNVAAKLQDARLRVWFPENHTYNPGLTVILSSSNTNPAEVWDSCNFVAPRPVSLRYVLGSARLHTNGTPNNVGAPLPGAEDAPIHDKGALLGDEGDGIIGQNGGFVIFQMSVTLG